MTVAVEFVVGIVGRIVSGLFTTYIIRMIDQITRKNNRHNEL